MKPTEKDWNDLEPGTYFYAKGIDKEKLPQEHYEYIAEVCYVDKSTTPETLHGNDIWDNYNEEMNGWELCHDTFMGFIDFKLVTQDTHPEHFL